MLRIFTLVRSQFSVAGSWAGGEVEACRLERLTAPHPSAEPRTVTPTRTSAWLSIMPYNRNRANQRAVSERLRSLGFLHRSVSILGFFYRIEEQVELTSMG